MDPQVIRAALSNANVKAFARVIREGESDQTELAYRRISGGGYFDSFADHPYAGQSAPPGRAAGAPQFIPHTWQRLQVLYPDDCKTFTPQEQDFGLVALVAGRGALDDVFAGRIEAAIAKCRPEWTSLPGAAENHPRYTLEAALAVYKEWGGTLNVANSGATNARQVNESTATTEQSPAENVGNLFKEKTMGSALSLLPLLAQYIPQIMTLIKPGSASTAKDAALAQTILNVATTAAGTLQAGQQATAAQVGAAVDAMAADPSLAKKVQQAVVTHPEVLSVLEIGSGGIAAARVANQTAANAEKPFWYNPAFWMSILLLPLVYWIVGSVLVGGITLKDGDSGVWKLFGTAFNQETRSGTVNLVIGMVLGGIVGIWFGTSYGSMRKTELAAQATADDKQ